MQVLKLWQEKYYHCLDLEFSKPEYFKVHHLLVLTYMLQTGGYSQPWFPKAVELLRRFLDGSIAPDAYKKQFSSIKDTNGIVEDKDQMKRNFDWNLDILGVSTESAEQYAEDVEIWALDVLKVIECRER